MGSDRINTIGAPREGDVFQVTDKDGRFFSLVYDGIAGGRAGFRLLGRNTSKKLDCDAGSTETFFRIMFKSIERVVRDAGRAA